MHDYNLSTEICKHHTMGQGYDTAQKLEIENREVEFVPFVIDDFSAKSSICVNFDAKIKL